MAESFGNSFWSPDYKTGIDKLNKQSITSLKQLHDLRQLVFNYMNYYHANSQFLNKLSIETSDSSFSNHRDDFRSEKGSPSRKLYQRRTFSSTFRKSEEKSQDSDIKQDTNDHSITVDVPVSDYVKDITAEANTLSSLASTIDREVLEDINDFIKSHEPFVRQTLDHLDELLNDYVVTFADVEKLKVDYSECRRLKEFSDNEKVTKKESDDIKDDIQPSHSENSEISIHINQNSDDEIEVDRSDNEDEFDFPIFIGPVKIKTQKELSLFLNDAIRIVDTTKRSFPLPGHKNEIFSSDELCQFLIHKRPFRLNPTRLNLERFGQSLLDLKLIMGSNLIATKKFKSEGVWFEWTDLAIFISDYESQTKELVSPITSSTNSTPTKKLQIIDEQTAKQVNEMANQTTKKFNDMFKNMKLSIMHTNYEEKLITLEDQYNEKFYDLHELKYLIDSELTEKTGKLESFEKLKYELIYKSLSKLSEVVYNFSLQSTSRLHNFASSMVKQCQNPENVENDLKDLLSKFSSGIFTPSILSPESFAKKQYSTAQSNNNFQNIKFQFNLYKDIPLQLKLSQTDKNDDLLSFTSLPFFIYQLIKLIENKNDSHKVRDLWKLPLDHQQYWQIKEKIINLLKDVNEENKVGSENFIQQTIIEKLIDVLSKESLNSLVNLLKNWLLEISDSLIPCVVYDSIIHIYQNESPDSKAELVKILSSIPRSNLSSLLFLVEHISVEFSLSQIPCYGLGDEFPSELKIANDESMLQEVSETLNSMDTIGAVPFTHLIFRPSPLKVSQGFKPPINIYNQLLHDLLNIDIRCSLFNNLIASEKNYITKKKQEQMNLGLQKKLPPPSPRRPASDSLDVLPKSPMPLPPSDSFSLRPFHTKNTPVPSPSASPRNLSRELFDAKMNSRERSSSGSFLAPGIDIEFEKK
ncbi:hypothetical protein CLIB1444_09S04038 [[Candida] jaroonii]|uniref:Uncharacterized protein n=1 Tax=[Candida] jaroonii TaxID=467808 RepID=A0ACA9YCN3_9ASCO|nr:hypothetical protein CLIB1444_09S04038 [[Candida] jaroonii]